MNNDLISREALKKRFDDYIKANPNISGIFELGKFIIDTAPTVDIKDQIAGAYNEGYACGSRENTRPQGEWIVESEPDENDNIQTICPFCRHSDTHSKSVIVSYCWNCGAKMKGGTK